MNQTTRPTIAMTSELSRFLLDTSMQATSMERTRAWLRSAYAHSPVNAYTYNGGTVLYIIGENGPVFHSPVHVVLVNHSLMQASPVTPIQYHSSDLHHVNLAGWRYISQDDLEDAGAL